MGNDAYSRLRQMIIDKELQPGEVLSERGISLQFGVGRMLVREAIRMLAQEGLLEVSPMRGTFVRQLSLTDLQEIHEVRLALEGMAASLAAQKGNPDNLMAIAKKCASYSVNLIPILHKHRNWVGSFMMRCFG